VAERAALVYVGATLEARDRAVTLVSDLRDVATSRKGAEKQITKLERRGNTARNQLERDVRKARTRLERQLRGRRRDAERLVRRNRARAEREVSSIERDADRRRNLVAEQVARVENVLQAGVTAGERFASTAKERVTAIA
jgi:F0F1-type ATP synthase membrane subunit b/b'